MKVHFAGNGVFPDVLLAAGVRYRLESFYDYCCRGGADGVEALNKYNHSIIDSGLFTLMFGAESHTVLDEAFLDNYLKKYVAFIKGNSFKNCSFVELDVQKKLSPEAAWHYRKKMKSLLPGVEIINTYHLEDGNPDKLIEYCEYIAVSIPELRLNVGNQERMRITNYIARKAKLKGKKVHLLDRRRLPVRYRRRQYGGRTLWRGCPVHYGLPHYTVRPVHARPAA